MDIAALIVAAFAAIVLFGMLKTGAGSPGGGFTREDEPAIYWTIFAVGLLGEGVLLYRAFSG